MDLKNKTAIVTGGTKGIGRGIAEALVREGVSVCISSRHLNEVNEAVDELNQLKRGRAVGFVCDVRDYGQVKGLIAHAVKELGGLDILINNAGIGAEGAVDANDDEEWRRVLDVNVLGTVRTTRAALEHLRASPAAAIVNTCSIAATAGLPQRVLYSATKGAVLAMTRAMAADHVREGIRVNCVAPGTADTPWVDRLLDRTADPAAERPALNARQPMGRLVTADEVEGAIAYLASPLSGASVGSVLAVDGGMHGLRLRPPAQAESWY